MKKNNDYYTIKHVISFILVICIMLSLVQVPVFSADSLPENSKIYLNEDISSTGDENEITPENAESPEKIDDEEINSGEIEFPDNAFSNDLFVDGDIGTSEPVEISSTIDPDSYEEIGDEWSDIEDLIEDSVSSVSNQEEIVGSVNNNSDYSIVDDLSNEELSTDEMEIEEVTDEIEESNDDLEEYSVEDSYSEHEENIVGDTQDEEEQEPNLEIIDDSWNEEVTDSSDDIGLSEISISVQVGKTTNVTVAPGNVNYSVYLTAYKVDPDMVSTSWGNWYDGGKKIKLAITGRKEGRTYIYVYMKRASNDETIASSRILVTVKGNPVIYANESSITLNQGSAKKVTMSYGGTSGTVYMSFSVSDNNVVKCEWGGWSGNTNPITVTGLRTGNAQVTVKLCDANTKDVLAYTTFSVSVKATARLAVSKNNMMVSTGITDTVTITVTNCTEGALKYGVTDSSVVSCSWGNQNGMSATLKITGKKGGRAVVYIYLYDISRQHVMTQTSINVTVISQPKVTASTNSLSLKVDEKKSIVLTVTDMNGDYKLGYALNSDRYVDCRWDTNWSGNSTKLYITGKNSGTVSIKVTLMTLDNKAVVSTNINVNVNPSDSPRIALSNSTLTIKKNQSGTVYVYFYNVNEDVYLQFVKSNSSITKCEWGRVSNNYAPLTITGLVAGKSTVNIYLKRSRDDRILSSGSVTVTIQENDSVLAEMSYSYANFNEVAPEWLYQYMYEDNQVARSMYEDAIGAGGNCFGFATTSGLFYVSGNGVNVNAFNSSKNVVSELSRGDRNVSWGLTSKEFVMGMMIAQTSAHFNGKRHYVATEGLSTIVSIVETEMRTHQRPVYITIRGRNLKGNDSGHGLLAYDVERTSTTEERLIVYDSNRPLTKQYITLRKNASGQYTSWSYDMGVHGFWGTGQPFNAIGYAYYNDYLQLWNNRGRLTDSNYNLIAANTDDLILKDVNNNVVASVQDGKLTTQDKDIFLVEIEQMDDPKGTLLYAPVRAYSIQNNDAELDELHVRIVNVELGTWVTTTADEVFLCADDDYSIMSAMIHDAKGENYDITLRSSREGEPEEISLNGTSDEDVISAIVDNGNLEVCNTENAELSIGDVNAEKMDISDCSISSIEDEVYTGAEITPSIQVKDGANKLVLNKDYTIFYGNNIYSGTATIKVRGIGKYKGEKLITFEIDKAAAKLAFEKNRISKNKIGEEFVNELQRTTDGMVTFTSSDKNVASVNKFSGKVTINGIGTAIITAAASEGENYKAGQANYTLTVTEGIEKASVAGVSLSYGYSGKAYTPNVTVKVNGVTLKKDTDYTIKYTNNVKPGTATITITGKGNYTGTRTKTFEIVDCVSSIVSGKTYQLIPKNNSKTAVSSFGGRMVNNTKVYITDRSSSEAMKFKAIKNSDGTWKFINAKCELALAVQQNSSALGAGLVLYDQTSRKAQNWKLSKKSDNSFAIMNAVTGYSIAMSDASAARGTTLSMAETASSGLQRFYLTETSAVSAPFDGTKSVRAAKDKTFGLNIASASKTDGANVNLYKYSNVNEKKFKIMYSGGGYYRLVNVNSGLCLTVKNDSSTDGANVIQSKWAAKNGQRWKVKKNSDGSVTLTNVMGTVLHLNGNKTVNGTNVLARSAATTTAQRWYLE